MSKTSNFLDFYLDTSIHVALAVLSLTFVTYTTLDITINNDVLVFVFFGTISAYNYIKYEIPFKPFKKGGVTSGTFISFLSIISLLVSAYHFIYLNKSIWLCGFLIALLIGGYMWPITKNGQNLRSLGIVKVLLVALVWTMTTMLIPVLQAEITIVSWDLWLLLLQQIILVLILLIPFEIRDLNFDEPNLKTIPQRVGVKKTKLMGGFLVFIYCNSLFLRDTLMQDELLQKGFISLLLLFVLLITKQKQSPYFAAFYVEGIPILWALAIIIFKN